MPRSVLLWCVLIVVLLPGGGRVCATAAPLEAVRVSDDGRGFALAQSGAAWRPWGFNYDHDDAGRLLDDYWIDEWDAVVGDFQEMRALGANTVRIHLQFGRFVPQPGEVDQRQIEQLGRLVELAAATGLYLDLTGLGCYHKADVPAWYDALDEAKRWAAQAEFWEAIARRVAGHPAVFCYDLMNEPVVAAAPREPGQWLGPAFAGKHFVQFITLDPADRPRHEVARQWCRHLVDAIRRHDHRTPITVGLVDWSLDRPGLRSGFVPEQVAAELDFISVHLYPQAGKVDEALETLAGFAVGKPVVIEETFPLRSSRAEFEQFLDRSREVATGWLGFYWGRTIDEYRAPATIAEAMMLGWLELFAERSARGWAECASADGVDTDAEPGEPATRP